MKVDLTFEQALAVVCEMSDDEFEALIEARDNLREDAEFFADDDDETELSNKAA